MISPGTVEEERSSDSSSFTYENRSTRIYNDSALSNPALLSKWKPGKTNSTELVLRLYDQKDEWNKYGGLTVLCGDGIMMAPVKTWWWMTEIFVLATVVLFAYEFFFINWIILVPAVVIAILEWMAFYKTCLRDPGVMPRPPFVDALKNLMSVLATGAHSPGTARVVVHPNGNQETLHYCWKCHHFRGMATSHCGVCDCCMIQHDHHCPVFGGCVAKNNLSSFHTMIVTMGLFWLYMMGYCIYDMISHERNDHQEHNKAFSSNVTPLTFYVILAEIGAVVFIPAFVNCFCGMFCRKHRKPQVDSDAIVKEKVEKIIQFARDNNFTLEEKLQLKEILMVPDISETRHGSQDCNHNSFFQKEETVIKKV